VQKNLYRLLASNTPPTLLPKLHRAPFIPGRPNPFVHMSTFQNLNRHWAQKKWPRLWIGSWVLVLAASSSHVIMVAPVEAGIYHSLTTTTAAATTKLFKCNITYVILLLLIKTLTDIDTQQAVFSCATMYNLIYYT